VQSLQYTRSAAPNKGAAIIDVGGGESTLIDDLLADGYANVTVLDLSATALEVTQRRLGAASNAVAWVAGDILDIELGSGTFDVWHDRAVFHFLSRAEDRARYVQVASQAVGASGTLIVATFASDGPSRCSGLPVSRYGATELAAEFEPEFEPVHDEHEEHLTPAGVVQPFTWVVLRRR
jgi:2-polyprenyl-3-methyl-5-hydroxy-6-metoxy-1,4-benzoquinol methylase